MSTGSWGLRSSGSYGSLQQAQNNYSSSLPVQTTPPVSSRKPQKMLKEKDRLFHWIFKFAPRNKVGMLLLCLVSAAVFLWVLCVAKGENAGESVVQRISIHSGPTTSAEKNTSNTFSFQGIKVERSAIANAPPTPPPPLYQAPPSPPAFFTGYSLPPGNPCETFALPPPPADKKRTGPRSCPVCYLPLEEAVALMPKAPSFSPMLKSLTFT